MRLVSFTVPGGSASVGVVTGTGTVRDLRPILPAGNGGLSPIRRLLLAWEDAAPDPGTWPDLEEHDLAAVSLLPLVPDPPKIVAAPVNYSDHQAEMNEAFHIDSLGVFLKAPTSVLPSGGTVRLPYTDRRFDQEGELALVIGRAGRDIPVDRALDHVAGYTCLLDITMRGGEDRSTRKSFDTFTPLGPYLVTPDETGPPESLTLRTWVDDELRQHADVKDLIWSVPEVVAYASSVMTLQVGDVVTTGTPAGVGQLADGSRIRVEIDRIGRLDAHVTTAGAVPCPTHGAGHGPVPPTTVTPTRSPVG
jgi:2-keto-4-pentenoate hydratase/2-oxohepta-3-ene-1,7-dioic acid hydratase in catechol pathway